MRNIVHEVRGDKLIITVDISAASVKSAPLSSTGKTKLVATGSQPIRDGVKFALNVTAPV